MDMPGAFQEAETPAPSLLPRYRTDVPDGERVAQEQGSRYVLRSWSGSGIGH